MSKKPETVPAGAGVTDLEELILGKEEYERRRAANPDGLVRVARKLTAADRDAIRAAKFVKVVELAKHFGVSATTIANIRSGRTK